MYRRAHFGVPTITLACSLQRLYSLTRSKSCALEPTASGYPAQGVYKLRKVAPRTQGQTSLSKTRSPSEGPKAQHNRTPIHFNRFVSIPSDSESISNRFDPESLHSHFDAVLIPLCSRSVAHPASSAFPQVLEYAFQFRSGVLESFCPLELPWTLPSKTGRKPLSRCVGASLPTIPSAVTSLRSPVPPIILRSTLEQHTSLYPPPLSPSSHNV